MKNKETALAHNIRMAVNRTGRARLLRNRLGSEERGDAKIPYGLGTGTPDLVGILLDGSARAFCLEIKVPKSGRDRNSQIAWWRWARKAGVTGGFARSIEDAMKLLAEAEREAGIKP